MFLDSKDNIFIINSHPTNKKGMYIISKNDKLGLPFRTIKNIFEEKNV